MTDVLDPKELKQLADDLSRIGLETVSKTLRRAAEEIERLRKRESELLADTMSEKPTAEYVTISAWNFQRRLSNYGQ